MPRSSQTVACERFSRKRRSWLIITMAEREALSAASRPSMATTSRWLVGSSSRRMSGSGASTRASAARRVSPPDRCAGSSSPVRPRLLQQIARAVRIVARREPGLDEGGGGGEARRDRGFAADSGWSPKAARSGVPASGSIIPAAILSSVDLPEPLRPTRHSRSDGPIDSSAPSSRGVPPKVRRMSLRKRSGGAMARLSDPNDLRLQPRLSRLLVAAAALSGRSAHRQVAVGQAHEDENASTAT